MEKIYKAVRAGTPLTDAQVRFLMEAQGETLQDMLRYAVAIKDAYFQNAVGFCAILNARSGKCSEDCAFCAQSAHYTTHSEVYPLVSVEKALKAARAMRAHGVRRFSLVTSGKTLSAEEFERFTAMVRAVSQVDGLLVDASPGILTREQLILLKENGLSGYHHNLETARSFFPHICTTHDYEDDVRAVRAAKDIGLYTCCGGIFGLGETWEHRVELARTLRELDVDSVPVNFLHPIPGTPLETRPVLTPEEARKIIALYRFLLPEKQIRVCGGRETVFGTRKKDVLRSGAAGIMVGDYLTTRGSALESDKEDVRNLGLDII